MMRLPFLAVALALVAPDAMCADVTGRAFKLSSPDVHLVAVKVFEDNIDSSRQIPFGVHRIAYRLMEGGTLILVTEGSAEMYDPGRMDDTIIDMFESHFGDWRSDGVACVTDGYSVAGFLVAQEPSTLASNGSSVRLYFSFRNKDRDALVATVKKVLPTVVIRVGAMREWERFGDTPMVGGMNRILEAIRDHKTDDG